MVKNNRRARAIRRERKKKLLIVLIIVVVVAAFAFALFLIADRQKDNRVYADGSFSVTLRANGTFDAVLQHNVRISGTYVEDVLGDSQNGGSTITFTHDGTDAIGSIDGDLLTIPEEWDDGHSHGEQYRLR